MKCRTCRGYKEDDEGGICPHCGEVTCFYSGPDTGGKLTCGNTGKEIVQCRCPR